MKIVLLHRMMAISIALVAFPVLISSSLNTERKISFQCNAEPASVVLAKLSKSAGMALASGPRLSNEYLVIDVNGVGIKSLLDKIAAAVSARWTWEGKRLVLNRTERRTQELRQQEANAFKRYCNDLFLNSNYESHSADAAPSVRSIVPHLAQLARKYRDLSDETELKRVEEQFRNESAKLPLAFTAHDEAILSYVPFERLGYVEPGQTMVFSTEPRGNQLYLPMPGTVRRDAEALNSLSLLSTDYLSKHRRLTSIEPMDFPKLGFAAKISLFTGNGLWFVTSRAYPRSGCNPNFDSSYGRLYCPNSTLPQTFVKQGVSVYACLSVASKRMAAILNTDFRQSTVRASQQLDSYERIEFIEPLAGFPSDLVRYLAKTTGRNLVASLSDEALWCGVEDPNMARSGQIYGYLQASHDISIDDPSWVVVKPVRPYTATKYRVDRKAVRAVLDAFQKSASLTLADIVQLASRFKQYNYTGRRLLQCILPQHFCGREPSNELGTPVILAISALLPVNQRQLLSTGRLYARQLTYDELKALNRVIQTPHNDIMSLSRNRADQPKSWNCKLFGIPQNAILDLTCSDSYAAVDPSSLKDIAQLNEWASRTGILKDHQAVYIKKTSTYKLTIDVPEGDTCEASARIPMIDQSRTYSQSEVLDFVDGLFATSPRKTRISQ